MKENYHFIGIGGIGMSGLARILFNQGFSVTGSDIALNANIEKLIHEGVQVTLGHSAENITSPSTIVYSSDIKSNNLEYEAAIKLGIPLMHRSQLLAHLIHEKRSFAVGGTHGKTTTSSLLTSVFVQAGLDPSYALGGIVNSLQTNACGGSGQDFILEADESDGSFLNYHPYGAIVTNIDRDHLVSYQGCQKVLINAFKNFLEQVQSKSHLFWCGDDFHLRHISQDGQSYGFHETCDWKIIDWKQVGFFSYFDLEYQGKIYQNIELSLIGKHNIQNAAAVFGLSIVCGISEDTIRETFKKFQGVSRRCQNKGTFNNIHFLDDYAHHPTEIKTTLEGIRKAEPLKRLIAVFQPHRYTRTEECKGLFGSVFDAADYLILTDIYSAGEKPIPGISIDLIKEEIESKSSMSCRYHPRVDLSDALCQLIQPNDLVITLGAGDITHLSSEVISLLENSLVNS